MRVLAIETSCDETASAVVEGTRRGGLRVLSNVVSSQANLHARTGGVVPEVAARAHVEAITFVIADALREAFGNPRLAERRLDAVAVTTEPGLRPALIVGEAAARAVALAWGKPVIPINHLAGHIAAAWLPWSGVGGQGSDFGSGGTAHLLPAVILIVSGGHTQLWKMGVRFRLRLLGETRDDAAGEAFDKIARLLGLPYPGGPALARLAARGNPRAFAFPRPMIRSGTDDFSFSGLKTAVYYAVSSFRKPASRRAPSLRADLAASAQEAIVSVLVAKTVAAARREGARAVILTGGVAANFRLRARLRTALGATPLLVPSPEYCTDNAAMIGAAAILGLRLPRGE